MLPKTFLSLTSIQNNSYSLTSNILSHCFVHLNYTSSFTNTLLAALLLTFLEFVQTVTFTNQTRPLIRPDIVCKRVEKLNEEEKFVTVISPCVSAFPITPILSARRCPLASHWRWGRSSLSKHCSVSQEFERERERESSRILGYVGVRLV